TAFETPTRQAFLLELIEHREDLPNAIALPSMLFQSTRFVGPSVAGLVLAALGEAWCFLANALFYLAIIATYAVVRVKPRKPLGTGVEWWRELASGFAYAFGFTGTRRLLLLLMAMGFFTAPWSSLMPIFAAETFSGDSRTFGFLIGAVGLGAIAVTFALAARGSVRGRHVRVGPEDLGASGEARLPEAGNLPRTAGVGYDRPIAPAIAHLFFIRKVKTLSASSCESSWLPVCFAKA